MSGSMVMQMKNEALANAAALQLETCENNHYTIERIASGVSERFLRAAELLPEGEFLGWQLDVETTGRTALSAFSSPGVRMGREDLDWIFQKCARAGEAAEAPGDLAGPGRRVYTLRHAPQSPEETGRQRRRSGSLYDDLDGGSEMLEAQRYLRETLETMGQTGAILRIAARPAGGGRGAVLISLPGEMSLRLKTMLRLAFRDAVAREVTGSDAEDLPPECLLDGMAGLLHVLMHIRAAEAEEEQSEELPENLPDPAEPEGEPATRTPIEELDLSLRAFNCLRRAGIDTVETLRTMTDADLGRIRNLGKRSIAEVRQKLRSFVPRSAPAPACSETLDTLIGLAAVKEQVRRIAAFAKMKRDMAARGREQIPMVLNMEFVGNPGTAKTTVARIVAGMFHEMGLLSSGAIVEVGRADLVARYMGQTAEKVRALFEQASGRLLFIDEAYALLEDREGEYGDEAINTIVQEMENHRADTVVIFAGYPDKMDAFFARNPGLRSRVPYRICFSDYCAEEMVQIAELEAKKRGFAVSAEAREKIGAVCAQAARRPEMGNGRFCRNLVERAILGYASRVYGGDGTAADGDFTLAGADVALPAELERPGKSNPIGFRL